MTDGMATVIAAGFGTLGVIVTAWLSNRKVKTANSESKDAKHRAVQAELEVELQRTALDFTVFVREWGDLHTELVSLMESTCIDRFMILRAWNGRLEPRWTTAVFQLRLGGQEPISYVHYPLDDDYVDRMRLMANHGHATFRTEDMGDCAIRDIYTAEGVTGSHWCFIEGKDIPGSENSRAVTYCSFATHDADQIPAETATRCNIIVGRLQHLASLKSYGKSGFEKYSDNL